MYFFFPNHTLVVFILKKKFRLYSTFPETHGGVYQHARYLYYTGRINAIQLHYSEAFQELTQAARKAPQKAAVGFRQTVNDFFFFWFICTLIEIPV